MKILFLICIIILSTLSAHTHRAFGETNYRMRTFVSQDLGIQFKYPEVWGEPIEFANLVTFIIRDAFSRSIDLFIIQVGTFNLDTVGDQSCNCKNLMDFVRWDYDKTFRSDNNLTIQNQTIVNRDHNAWQMKLSSIPEKEMTQKLLVWTIDGNTGYRIQYSAPAHRFTEYLTGFEDMLRSFNFPEHSEKKPTCMLFNIICF